MAWKKNCLDCFVAVLVTVTMIAMTSGFSAKAQSGNGLGTDPIVGSWHVTLSFDDGRPNVLALYTFDRERNFVMDGSWPGLFGPGNGSWNRDVDSNGNANVDLTFFRLLYSPLKQTRPPGP